MTKPDAMNFVIEPNSFVQADLPSCSLLAVSTLSNFTDGHISDATLIPWQATLNHEGPHPGLPPAQHALNALLTTIAYKPTQHYIVYDDEGGGWAGRFIWLLHMIGHQSVSYLNGGKLAWQKLGFPLVQGPPNYPAERTTVCTEICAYPMTDSIMEDLKSENRFQYWDARSHAEFTGAIYTARRNGHIPSAIHCEWTDLMDANNGYKIHPHALDKLATKGLNPDKPCITYCQSNHRAGFTYLVGRHLGMDIQTYPSGWSDWGNRTDTPLD